uniref:Threonylcarbamoyl-AMP synthase n=1 Tax=Serinus canaria TaxID=9135 RepID=A0A8C9NPE3_SERCA
MWVGVETQSWGFSHRSPPSIPVLQLLPARRFWVLCLRAGLARGRAGALNSAGSVPSSAAPARAGPAPRAARDDPALGTHGRWGCASPQERTGCGEVQTEPVSLYFEVYKFIAIRHERADTERALRPRQGRPGVRPSPLPARPQHRPGVPGAPNLSVASAGPILGPFRGVLGAPRPPPGRGSVQPAARPSPPATPRRRRCGTAAAAAGAPAAPAASAGRPEPAGRRRGQRSPPEPLDPPVPPVIYSLKGRNGAKPLAICLGDVERLYRYCRVNVPDELLRDLLPGPVTLVLERSEELNKDLNPFTSLVGVRIPDHPFMRDLARACPGPLALTSANISSQGSTLTVLEFQDLWPQLSLVIDGGPIGDIQSPECRLGSTVVDLSVSGKFSIIRPGCALMPTVEILKKKYGLVPEPS